MMAHQNRRTNNIATYNSINASLYKISRVLMKILTPSRTTFRMSSTSQTKHSPHCSRRPSSTRRSIKLSKNADSRNTSSRRVAQQHRQSETDECYERTLSLKTVNFETFFNTLNKEDATFDNVERGLFLQLGDSLVADKFSKYSYGGITLCL